MFHNIPTPFETLSYSFHKIAFICKSRMCESIDHYSVNGLDLRNKS